MNMRTIRQILSLAVTRAAGVGCITTALVAGCVGGGAAAPARTATKPNSPHLEPAPAELGSGVARIASVNAEHGFVVVDFASRTMPEAGTLINVYRGEKRVGGIRITEPVHAPLATADIVEGEMRVGDEVR
jgi:hypothetical protein